MKNPNFFPTLRHFLTKIHLDSSKSQNIKVVAYCIIYNFDSQSIPKRGLYLKLQFLEQGYQTILNLEKFWTILGRIFA